MTGLLPAALAAQLASGEQRHWWDRWTAQLRTTCDGCAEDDQVMVVEDGVRVCSLCHEACLAIWRKEDEEDERRDLVTWMSSAFVTVRASTMRSTPPRTPAPPLPLRELGFSLAVRS